MPTRRQLLALFFAPACGPAAEQPATPAPVAPPPPPPPRDADRRAAQIVGAKLTATIDLEQVRGHPLASRLTGLAPVSALFEGTGIEPLHDVDRAFVAGRDLSDRESVVAVAEHTVPPARLERALQQLVEQSGEDGKHLEQYPFPAARVKVRGQRSVVLLVKEDLLVITSKRYAGFVRSLAGTGGLPKPTGGHALVARAMQPSETLDAPRVPEIPPTIERADASLTLVSGGAAELSIDAQSSDPAQAEADAVALTEAVDDATSVSISVVKIRAFDPVEFRAEGSRVKAQRRITRRELETLVGLAEMATE